VGNGYFQKQALLVVEERIMRGSPVIKNGVAFPHRLFLDTLTNGVSVSLLAS